MFKTYKIPIKLSEEDESFIKDMQRQYSLVVRYAYNRFLEGSSEKDIRSMSKTLKSIPDLNSWLIQCAILDAKAVFTRFNVEKNKEGKTINSKHVFFGGKNLLNRLHRGLISKEEFKDARLRLLDIQGEVNYYGNRMFNLKIQDSNRLVFKVNRSKHIEIPLPKLRNNWLNALWKLEVLAENKQLTYSVKLTSSHIYISFDYKQKEEIVYLENRCLGIDMNPNFIGVSVLEFSGSEYKVLDTKMYDIQALTVRSRKASSDLKSKYLHNKLQFETIEITKKILNICKAWNIKFVYLEELNFKNNSDNGKGFNRLTKNKWLKNLFQEQLKKRLDIFGFKHFNINPMYTSVIGNLQHEYLDPINASIEIARRGQEVIINKTKKFYPDVWIKESFDELWKQTQSESPEIWKDIFSWLKNSKLKYRVSLEECKKSYRVFSLDSIKSKVYLYSFI